MGAQIGISRSTDIPCFGVFSAVSVHRCDGSSPSCALSQILAILTVKVPVRVICRRKQKGIKTCCGSRRMNARCLWLVGLIKSQEGWRLKAERTVSAHWKKSHHSLFFSEEFPPKTTDFLYHYARAYTIMKGNTKSPQSHPQGSTIPHFAPFLYRKLATVPYAIRSPAFSFRYEEKRFKFLGVLVWRQARRHLVINHHSNFGHAFRFGLNDAKKLQRRSLPIVCVDYEGWLMIPVSDLCKKFTHTFRVPVV